MSNADPVSSLSPRRRHLASFEHAYAVALQMRREGGKHLFIVGTKNPLQPFRVAQQAPADGEAVLALVA